MRTLLIAGAILCAVTVTAHVQQPPDLGGTWAATRDAPPTAGVGAAPSPVFGDQFALRTDDGRLILLRPVRGRASAVTTVLPLDGAETRVLGPSRPCFGQSGQVVSAKWVSDTLRYAVTGTIPPGGGTPSKVDVIFTFRKMSPDAMVIETTMRTSATSGPVTVGTVYRRSSERLEAEPPPAPPVAPAIISQVSWIAGDWVAPSGSGSVQERWSPANGGAMIATSRTVRRDVMTEFEFLCIFEREGTLVYTAMPNAGPATSFTLTAIDADSATFENPEHDFPKTIRYARRTGGSMEVVVSGGVNSRSLTFVYTRQDRW